MQPIYVHLALFILNAVGVFTFYDIAKRLHVFI
jgi:hypothetical protein